MLRHILLAATLLLGLLPDFVLATDKHCPSIIKKEGIEPKECKCGGPLLSYPHSGAKTLPLVAVCGYAEESWGSTGSFFLEGSTLLQGKVRREQTETFGDWPTFLINESSMKSLPTSDSLLRFGNEAIAIKKFHIPPITAKAQCWTANASIYLKKLYVLEGPGTDADGSYIIDFAISKVARFKKCKPSE